MVKQKKPFTVVEGGGVNKAEQIAKEAAELAAIKFLEEYDNNKRHCGSPIEEMMLAALMEQGLTAGYALVFMGNHAVNDRWIQQETVYIHQQAEVGKYRADFLIHDCSVPFEISKPRLMAVECDGHDFHEKTKSQARHDKRRDRFFQSMGIKLLRYTGSEIWADARECAEEVLEELACNDSWRNRSK